VATSRFEIQRSARGELRGSGGQFMQADRGAGFAVEFDLTPSEAE
jgi:hypothetical protein